MNGPQETIWPAGTELDWPAVNSVHRQHQGINRREGVATSILFEAQHGARYEDRWLVPGQVLDYVGHGDEPADQVWDSYNTSLRNAMAQNVRVHVFERVSHKPLSRFVYHGHWRVLEANQVTTPNGRLLIRFLLSANSEWHGIPGLPADAPLDTPEPPGRQEVTTLRVIRDSPMARRVKEVANFTCQLCGLRQLRGNGQPYAEAHHIQPLGRNGPDVKENLVVLCARHHVDFDYGAVAIDPLDRQSIHHRYDVDLHGRRLATPMPPAGEQYLRFHWETVYGKRPQNVSNSPNPG